MHTGTQTRLARCSWELGSGACSGIEAAQRAYHQQHVLLDTGYSDCGCCLPKNIFTARASNFGWPLNAFWPLEVNWPTQVNQRLQIAGRAKKERAVGSSSPPSDIA
jgi:hypothetical protein